MRKQCPATSPTPPPLPLGTYTVPSRRSDRPTLGLHTLHCPLCGHAWQRLMRAHQFWRDGSDYLCPQIHVEMDFLCGACKQGWQIHLWNEDEGEGEIILDISQVETVNSQDAQVMGEEKS